MICDAVLSRTSQSRATREGTLSAPLSTVKALYGQERLRLG